MLFYDEKIYMKEFNSHYHCLGFVFEDPLPELFKITTNML